MAENRNGPLARTEWLLAIESATGAASAALWRGGETRDAEPADPDASSAAGLLPAIDRLLQRAGLAPSQLGAWAIAIGPGSFTGLRIGVATLKGLAFGSEAPVAAVSTLAALARGAGPGGGRWWPARCVAERCKGWFRQPREQGIHLPGGTPPQEPARRRPAGMDADHGTKALTPLSGARRRPGGRWRGFLGRPGARSRPCGGAPLRTPRARPRCGARQARRAAAEASGTGAAPDSP